MFKYSHQSISVDEVAVVPEAVRTYSDDDVDLSVEIGRHKLSISIIGAAMDSVSSIGVVSQLCKFGGIGFVNLCGLISRYKLDEYKELDACLRNSPSIKTLQDMYLARVMDVTVLSQNLDVLLERLGPEVEFGVSSTPQHAERLFDIALQKGVKLFALQSSFVSPYWTSNGMSGLDIAKLTEYLHQNKCTFIVGNVASLNAAVPFIEAEVDAIIEGVGPGRQCTTRFVLGIGAGHVTVLTDIREYIEKQKSPTKVIADGGIHDSGDIVKLICCGAHAVILGSMLAQTIQAPFLGYHWGMSSYHKVLPRGTLLQFNVDDQDTVEKLLFGPSYKDDGTLAIIPAIKNAFSNLGVLDINSAYRDTVVVRFAGVRTEGKR